jgi:chromosome segregation protein
MRLLRIEITGFKSFCDKTVINLVQDGISVVVGPNGCGKSNIVDAVRWTLGTQSAKHLRGTAMEDVIFNGSSVRQPVNLAQVNLVFTNPEQDTIAKYAEFSEIVITRRLYRSGESQYLINKTHCRLTDIRELFMDTGISGKGYSIIEQGKIDQIVTSRAEDRRLIIDEAAGIVKFKSKRKDAERKFATTKQNLLRVEDILSELENQEESLKEQVEKAEEYLNAKGRLERLQQCILAKQWHKLDKEAERTAQNRENNLQRQGDRQLIVTDLSVNESALNLDIEREVKAQEDLRVQLQSKKEDIIKLESKLETDRIAKDNLDEWEEKGKEEIVLLEKQIKTIEFQIESYQTQANSLEKQLEDMSGLIEQLEEREKISNRDLSDLQIELEQLQKEHLNTVAELTSDQNQLSQLKVRQTEIQLQEEQVEEQISNFEIEKTKFELEHENLQHQLGQIVGSKTELDLELEKHSEITNDLQEKIRLKSSDLQTLVDESLQIKSRHSSLLELVQNHEEFDSAAKKFLDYYDENPEAAKKAGFLGTLADLVSTAEPVSKNISALLNRHFNLLIFQSVEHLESLVQTAEQLKAEQVQVYFMDLSTEAGSESKGGVISNLFKSSKTIAGTFPLVDTYQTIENPVYQLSRKQLEQADGLIDPSANIMTPEKIFLIGAPDKSNPTNLYFERRSELTELENRLVQITAKVKGAKEELENDNEQLMQLSQSEEQQKKSRIELDMAKLSIEKELDALNQALSRINSHGSALTGDLKNIVDSLQKSKADTDQLINNIENGEKSKQDRQESIQKLQTRMNETSDSKQTHLDELQQVRVNFASHEEKVLNNRETINRLTNDRDDRNEKLVELNSHSDEKREQRDGILSSIKETNDRLPILLENLEKEELEIKKLSDKIETDRSRLLTLQNSLATEQHKINQLRERTHKQDIRLAQLTQESKNIAENLYTEDKMTPQELLQTFDVAQFNIEKETENITVLKQHIGGMEDINLAAKKEYDKLIERIDFLTTQSQDLNQSIKALEESIDKINQESKRRFREAFYQINEQFSKTFPELFGGGEAFLRLTDESDVLEAGVDIIAKPPGKKLQNMSLLSGGEKALTAIALVFSIFQIKPSPFCLLDEVDAPLDDANNNRFNQHVKDLTKNSQFIIITHNKKTMEIGNALFGVTMEEPGISKIVSVEMTKSAADSLPKAG